MCRPDTVNLKFAVMKAHYRILSVVATLLQVTGASAADSDDELKATPYRPTVSNPAALPPRFHPRRSASAATLRVGSRWLRWARSGRCAPRQRSIPFEVRVHR